MNNPSIARCLVSSHDRSGPPALLYSTNPQPCDLVGRRHSPRWYSILPSSVLLRVRLTSLGKYKTNGFLFPISFLTPGQKEFLVQDNLRTLSLSGRIFSVFSICAQ